MTDTEILQCRALSALNIAIEAGDETGPLVASAFKAGCTWGDIQDVYDYVNARRHPAYHDEYDDEYRSDTCGRL